MRKKLLIILALMLMLSACEFDAESLMKAPKPPVLIEHLSGTLASLEDGKNEYAAPSSGYNRQAVQAYDLDGDGTEEALIFMRSKADNSLSVYVYTLYGEEYVQIGHIINEADNIDSVTYADLTGDGTLEIIIGWSKENLKALTVHTLEDNSVVQLVSSVFTQYVLFDIDGDSRSELLIIRVNDTQLEGVVEMYSYSDGVFEISSTAPLSTGINEFRRDHKGTLSDGGKALFVTCRYQDREYITDIITFRNNELKNISLIVELGASVNTVSGIEMYPMDIDYDGITELPIPEEFPPYDPLDEASARLYKYVWITFDSIGRAANALETYHSSQGGWYFIIPPEWNGRITVRRIDTAKTRSVVFSYWQPDIAPIDLLTVQAVQVSPGTAVNAEGKVLVKERSDLVILAEIFDSAPAVDSYRPTDEDLVRRIFFITTDWLTG